MDSVPKYAAVSATIDQVREQAGAGPTGFANAVLRKVAAAGDALSLYPAWETDPAGFLATWGSHPRWLVERWLGRWDAASVRRLVESDNRRPESYLVPLGTEASTAGHRLAARGIDVEAVGEGSRCLRLPAGSNIPDSLDAASPAIIQDPAANLVSSYADVPSGTMVADLCAAPGGKVLALPALPGFTLAADRSEPRIRMLRENARRTGTALAVVVADALHPPIVEAGVVLLDVPCTGTGTLARHPDARWRLREESIAEMSALQSQLLSAAADVVAQDGLLVYSTCSLEAEENEGVVEAFLADHSHFEMAPTAAVPDQWLDGEGRLVVRPQDGGFDGSFAARMRRGA
jgi:16S rRNA (cytosine967-C5)-methyltransferase